MKQSQASIKRTIKKLREIIDSTEDVETRRMAYFAETTLRWAIEDTVSWKRPEEDLQDEVFFLKQEAAQHSVQADGADSVCPECGAKLNYCTECEKRVTPRR